MRLAAITVTVSGICRPQAVGSSRTTGGKALPPTEYFLQF